MSLIDVEYNMNSKGIHATGFYDTSDGSVTIKAGSTLTTGGQSVKSAHTAHQKLLREGIIKGNVFDKDYKFDTPTAAGVLLVGRQMSGPQGFSISGTSYPLARLSRIYNIGQSIKGDIKKTNYPKELTEDLIKWFLSHIGENTDNPTKENFLSTIRRINDEYEISQDVANISDEGLDKAIRIAADANGWLWGGRAKGNTNNKNSEGLFSGNIYSDPSFSGSNILYYGVPGCGKSYSVKKEIEKEGYISKRILFHPEYSYADFVGQILPKKKGNDIVYEFVAGPFTEILCEALKNPKNKYCLVIEEINRGNASAIFGDVFQLLDREREGSDKGVSEYSIQNEWISGYLSEEGLGIKEIKIPKNLSLMATMNSSDQNVFVLDTAFKRRWNFKKISNEFLPSHPFKDVRIQGTDVTREEFVIKINNAISKLSKYGINGDDKQIGLFFVSREDLEDREKFAEKILLYLWEDVVKFNKTLLFKDEFTSIDKLINGFMQLGFEVFKDGIFTAGDEDLI